MRRPKWVDSSVVDQNIDMSVSELDRFSGHFARARRVSQVRRYKIRFASCSADFCNRLVATLRIAAHHYDMDAKRGQFISCRSANPAGSACNKCLQRIGSHLQFSLSDFGVAGRNFRVKWLRIRPNENKLSRHRRERALLSLHPS
jgi:hypothetical protein